MSTPEIPKLSLNRPASRGSRSPRPRAVTPTGRKASPTPSSAGRSASAGREKPSSPLTPRQKKATRSLFKELGQTSRVVAHMLTRVKQTKTIVTGTIGELTAAAEGAQTSLATNPRFAAATKETGEKIKCGSSSPTRPMNPTEMEELTRQMREQLAVAGEERFPTRDEIHDRVAALRSKKKLVTDVNRRRVGMCNKPIVEALERLRNSAARLAVELVLHEDSLTLHATLLEEVYHTLVEHEQVRDQIFDPHVSNPLIKRSVLYQKCNPMAPIKLELDDKDQGSVKGRNSLGLTGHEATGLAAEREDVARSTCVKALKAVRDAQSEFATRKSMVQVAVRTSRDMVMAQRRAVKTGKFGSSGERNTDPATRKTATNPEDDM